ncbi:hypothetical protein Tco_0181170, partial [Tanacetum coccineum]
MEETVRVTFNKNDEAISQSSTEGDGINFNENRTFPGDEFLEPRSEATKCPGNTKYFPYIHAYENTTPSKTPVLQISVTLEDPPEFTNADDHLALSDQNQLESADHLELADHLESANNLDSAECHDTLLIPQDRWSREKHIELVNIIGEPLAGITTISRVRDSEAALVHECLYVNFLSEMEPKKLTEALEEGWI